MFGVVSNCSRTKSVVLRKCRRKYCDETNAIVNVLISKIIYTSYVVSLMGVLLIEGWNDCGRLMIISNVALNRGSSKHGKTLRACTGSI